MIKNGVYSPDKEWKKRVRVFTREELMLMDSTYFAKYEKLILQQIRKGLIK